MAAGSWHAAQSQSPRTSIQVKRRSVVLRDKLQSQFLLTCWLAETTNATAFLKAYTQKTNNASTAWFCKHYIVALCHSGALFHMFLARVVIAYKLGKYTLPKRYRVQNQERRGHTADVHEGHTGGGTILQSTGREAGRADDSRARNTTTNCSDPLSDGHARTNRAFLVVSFVT